MYRKSLVATAVALGLSCSAFGANLNPGSDNILPVGGATAQDRSLAIGWLTDLCDPAGSGGIEVFTTRANFLSTTATGTISNYAIACKLKSTANGAAASQDVIVYKYSGGSGTGTTNVGDGTPLANTGSANWVDIAACVAAQPSGTPTTMNGIPYSLRVNCPTTGATSLTPKAGIADVEPALLGTPGAKVTTLPGAAVPFGVIVSKNFFEALQTAEKGAANSTIPGTCNGNVSSYTPECTPSLSSAVLRGIFKGNILTVASLRNQTGVAIPNPAGSPLLHICRRGNNSGTMASFKSYFLGEGCGGVGNQHTFAKPTNSGTEASGQTYVAGNTDRVFAGAGNGDVLNCLDDKNDQNRYAVGIASLETNSFGDGTGSRWRFIKLNGVFPSLENVVRAEYDFFSESACNRPSAASTNNLSAVQAALASGTVISGTQTATGLCGAVRGDAVTINPSTTSPWVTGTLTIPASTAVCPTSPLPATTASVQANPTNSLTKAVSFGGTPNNCNTAWTACATVTAQDDNDTP
jgi:hypothetical protein